MARCRARSARRRWCPIRRSTSRDACRWPCSSASRSSPWSCGAGRPSGPTGWRSSPSSPGAATAVFGALGWGGGPVGAAALLVQLSVLFAATGGVFAAMILGHWYLVTPRLPEAPLILLSRILLGVMALQVALFVAWVGLGAGPASGGTVQRPDRAMGAVRLVAAHRRTGLPADRVVGGRPDGPHPVDGVGDRSPVHQRRHDRGRHDPRRRAVLRRRLAGLTEGARTHERRAELDPRRDGPRLDRIDRRRPPRGARGDRDGRRSHSASRSSTATPGASCRSWPAASGGSSRSGRRTASRRCGWRSASRPTARSSRSTRTASEPISPGAGGAQAGIPDERITVAVGQGARGVRGSGDPALAGPFDLAFIDALKPEYGDYLDALTDGRLAPGALVLADNVLWSGRVSGATAVESGDRNTEALRAFSRRVLGDSRFTCHDPAGR